jgi:hypothetical protein
MALYGKQLALFALICHTVSIAFCLEPLPASNPFLISTSGLTAMSDDPSTTLINPAAGLSGVSSSVSYLYNMDELSQCEISTVLEYQDSGVFIGWQTLENDAFTKQDYRFGYRFGYKFFKLGIGYKLSYDNITGYGSEKDDCLYSGLRLDFTKTTFDFSIDRIKVDEDMAAPEGRTAELSLSQELSGDTAVAFGVSTLHNEPVNYKVGCRFLATKHLQGIVSWSSEPGRFGIGSAFSLSWLKLIYAVQTHPELHWTHSIGISIMFP